MRITLTYNEIYHNNQLKNLTKHILRESQEFNGFDNECFVLVNKVHSDNVSDLKHCVLAFEIEGTDREILPRISVLSFDLVNYYLRTETASLVWGEQPNGANIYPTLNFIINAKESDIEHENDLINIINPLVDKWF